MAIGMSADEFWHGDCFLTQAYLKKEKIARDRRDFEEWKQGLYFLDAVSVAIARGINGKKADYPKEPYGLKTPTRKEQTMKENVAAFEAFAAVHNAKKKVENGG
ncbi:MAG: hypothetical protein J6S63_01240 [Atopobiaceae bacterium]|nr:hypothetical protein [Atopobiaceae bacterium]